MPSASLDGHVDPEATRYAWNLVVRGGKSEESAVRRPVQRAWQRSLAAGSDAHVIRAAELPPPQVVRLLLGEARLVDAARPYMVALSRAAGGEHHAAMLGDARGIVLEVVGDEESVHGPQRVPGPGSLLDEAHAGANGIGTTLAERGYVELVGPEHFIQGFHSFTCQGVPLHGPDGDLVGVLSTSVRRVEASVRLREILLSAARGIEAELMRHRLEDDVDDVLRSGVANALALEALRQDIIQVHAAARLRFEKAARVVAGGETSAALTILEVAEALIDEFRRRSLRWREIATGTQQRTARQPPETIELAERVREVVGMLQTEAAVRGVRLRVGTLEQAVVLDDSIRMTTALFREVLSALDDAKDEVTVDVVLDRREHRAELRVRADAGGAKTVITQRLHALPDGAAEAPHG